MVYPPPPAPTLKNVCAPTHAPHVAFSLLILFMRLCNFDIGSFFFWSVLFWSYGIWSNNLVC